MSEPTVSSNPIKRVRNALVAIIAIALSVTLFLALNSDDPVYSLDAQVEKSLPLEVAVTNNKPTLLEFYADWCTSCQAMAKDLEALKQEYHGSVNFVMLNVDNTKWLPEILSYDVDGIPHFAFLNEDGNAIAQTIGEQPYPIMEANLNALIAHSPLPYSRSIGRISDFDPKDPKGKNSSSGSPLSHSSQSSVN